MNAPPADHYLVMTPDFFKGAYQPISSISLANWETYLRWQLVNASSSLLSGPFVDEKFDFYGHTLLDKERRLLAGDAVCEAWIVT